MKHLINKLGNKISNLFKFGYVTKTNDDSGNIPYLQISYFDEKVINSVRLTPYGLCSMPPTDEMVVLQNICGQEENSTCIPFSLKDRFKNLKPGEVAIGNFKTKSFIKFTEDGGIEIESKANLKITLTGDFQISSTNMNYSNGNFNINLPGDYKLNSAKMSFFGAGAVAQQPGGALNAGGSYTPNEQSMINKMYTAMRNYGLLT